ncbi:MAG: DUF1963 domain-containing protein [Planctomycetales bacterium]|nr:DUF1963 domain-containing protein [Planctomycetales bacterium]
MQVRYLCGPLSMLGRAVPTDIFILGIGELGNRFDTKIGGIPYWAIDREWPRTATGDLLPFFAQIDLRASHDLLGDLKLPGDVLLIFGDPQDEFSSGVQLKWEHVVVERKLISRETMPISPRPCFNAVRWRTETFPFWEPRDASDTSRMTGDDGNVVLQPYNAFSLIGLQVCRMPYILNSVELSDVFCCIPCFTPTMGVPYPFLNRNEAIDDEDEAIALSCSFSNAYLSCGDGLAVLYVRSCDLSAIRTDILIQ